MVVPEKYQKAYFDIFLNHELQNELQQRSRHDSVTLQSMEKHSYQWPCGIFLQKMEQEVESKDLLTAVD